MSSAVNRSAAGLYLVLVGPPGSGKGTQAVRLARRYGVPHLSTGDVLREAVRSRSALGREVAAIMASGALVGDDLMGAVVRERLAQPDAARGCILDGYPRTAAQAEFLDGLVPPASLLVALFEVEEDALVRRLSTRRVCESCRLTQTVADPSEGDTCPYCGGHLVRREDDREETVRRRLATYQAQCAPLLAHYRSRPGFFAVDGLQRPDAVNAALVREIDRRIA